MASTNRTVSRTGQPAASAMACGGERAREARVSPHCRAPTTTTREYGPGVCGGRSAAQPQHAASCGGVRAIDATLSSSCVQHPPYLNLLLLDPLDVHLDSAFTQQVMPAPLIPVQTPLSRLQLDRERDPPGFEEPPIRPVAARVGMAMQPGSRRTLPSVCPHSPARESRTRRDAPLRAPPNARSSPPRGGAAAACDRPRSCPGRGPRRFVPRHLD